MTEPSLEEQRAAEAALYAVQPVTLIHTHPELIAIGSLRDTEEATLILTQGTDTVILSFAQTLTLAKTLRDFFAS